jgi:hypothetical protein
VLLEWTVRTFDRCLGRMPERGASIDAQPAENAPVYQAVQVGARSRREHPSAPQNRREAFVASVFVLLAAPRGQASSLVLRFVGRALGLRTP